MMHSFFRRPSKPLCDHIAQYWFWLLSSKQPIPDILPGTGAELLINLGPPLSISQPFSLPSDTAQALKTGSGLLICPRKSIFRLESSGQTMLLSIRFRSAGLYRLFGIPLTELVDKAIDAAQLLPAALLRQLSETTSPTAAIALLDAWLHIKLNNRPHLSLELVQAIDQLYYHPTPDCIHNIQQQLKVSERTFQRRFKLFTGVDAKSFERTTRFQSTLRTLLREANDHYLDVALQNGYYDQSHFIKEFKRFTSLSPKRYLVGQNFALNYYNNAIYNAPHSSQ
jgi:AraC-like DNA-binding protein